MSLSPNVLRPNAIIRSTQFPEPLRVYHIEALGSFVKLIAVGVQSGTSYTPVLSPADLDTLQVSADAHPFNGDATRFRLGSEALRLALAYEYDPYFALSIARVDPLPHQLEAVYDYFLKSPRIRFLLADDPGAGKTIMAGLLLQELKARGLAKRILIVTPANLTFQWKREMHDKFRQDFDVLNSAVLYNEYGRNPWQDHNQVITSISWISRVDYARTSLLRSRWDLVIVDEAHKMSARTSDDKTLAYKIGEELSERTDHLLLMTATPHKGEAAPFALFLRLLDQDVYGDVQSLQEAMRRQEAPFYLRRVKEALVSFPDPDTETIKKLFTRRTVNTIAFKIDDDEQDFYYRLTDFVEEQSAAGASARTAQGRAVGFTMAMLQRRFASSVYAVRRTLERMKRNREKILEDPEAYRRAQKERRMPDDFDDLPEPEQQAILDELEATVLSVDPDALHAEIADLGKLISLAQALEQREVESKLVKLRETLTGQGVFQDPGMKVLIFTEHKDTLDYLAGDGRDGRPLGKLQQWGLSVTQIHGGMHIGDPNTPGTRIHAERAFRDACQVLVATEAAGEGINLQFCWFLVNYDIPWNPVRLEQRMGRIHRYGQTRDCFITNFVAVNTREGRVLDKLFERVRAIEQDLDPHGMGSVFNVLGEVLPANTLERMVREMYARNLSEDIITARIVREVDTARFRQITASTLEGLAKRELNLAAVVGKAAEAKERRLVPEVIEDFFTQAAPLVGLTARELGQASHAYRIPRIARSLLQLGEELEARFGALAEEYPRIVFDQDRLRQDTRLAWITPGHPLFETVREQIWRMAQPDMEAGAVFYDLNRETPACLDLFSVEVRDGRHRTLHRRLFVVQSEADGSMAMREPTLLLALQPAPPAAAPPDLALPDRAAAEAALLADGLADYVNGIREERRREVEIVGRHVEVSLNALIERQNLKLIALLDRQQANDPDPLLPANLKQAESRLDELTARLNTRRSELAQELRCTITAPVHHGRALVLPHPERANPAIAPMVRDDEIERIAVRAAIAHEESRGWQAESVETQNRGFDLISRRYSPTEPGVVSEFRYIEVKGRAHVGQVALSRHEYETALRLRGDYWLYVVFNCAGDPAPYPLCIQDPANHLAWTAVQDVVHFAARPEEVIAHAEPRP